MKPEAKFWQEIRGPLKNMGHCDRIESHTSLGRPDVDLFVTQYSMQVFIELKVHDDQKGVVLRPSQKMWHRSRHRAGGKSWVLVKVQKSASRHARYILIDGFVATELDTRVIDWITNATHIWEHGINWESFETEVCLHESK